MELKIGDLVLVKGEGPIQTLVEWAENGIYAHIAIYAEDGQVLEAQGLRKVGFAPLSTYAGQYDIGHIVGVSDAQREVALDYARSMIGWPYDWGLIFNLALKLLLHINKPYGRKAAVICSTYAVDAWRAPGVNLTNAEKPTPQEVADSPRIEIEKI